MYVRDVTYLVQMYVTQDALLANMADATLAGAVPCPSRQRFRDREIVLVMARVKPRSPAAAV